MMDYDIVTIGSAGFDIYLSGKSIKPSLMSIDNSIKLENDTKYNVEHSVYEAGGEALNSAILFARQGIATGIIAKMGKDHLANQIKIIAKHEGIGTDLIVNKPEHHTDLRIHLVTERNHEIELAYHNSGNSLRAKDVKYPKLKSKIIW